MRYINLKIMIYTVIGSCVFFTYFSHASVFIDKNIDRSHYASKCVKNNYYEGLNQALKENADPNYQDQNGQSLITIASGLNNIKTTELLLSYNADPNVYDKNNNNAYLLAAAHGNVTMLELLFAKSKFPINIDAVDKADNTALMIAVNKRNYDTVKFLLEKGNKVNYVNKRKLTPLLIAVMFGNDDTTGVKIVELLLANHANIHVKSTGNISILDYAKKRKLNNIYAKLIEYDRLHTSTSK